MEKESSTKKSEKKESQNGSLILLKILSISLKIIGYLLTLLLIIFILSVVFSFVPNAEDYQAVRIINQISYPVFGWLEGILPTTAFGYNFSWLVAIIAILILKGINNALQNAVNRFAFRLKTRKASYLTTVRPPISKESSGDHAKEMAEVEEGGGRASLLKQFISVKKKLEEAQKDLTFLAVDVIGSTKMKIQEDPAIIEYSFAEYKKFVGNILMKNRVWKVSWTPDGLMAAFWTTEDAIKAGQTILKELEVFNKHVNQMKSDIQIRSGANYGKVMFDLSAQMEEVSDPSIDLAGHLQKASAPNTLWISRTTFDVAHNKEGFVPKEEEVDNNHVMEWKA